MAFEQVLGEKDLLSFDFDWIIIDNMVIFPIEMLRVRCGDGFGSSVGYNFEYQILFKFEEDVMALIKKAIDSVSGNPRMRKFLESLLFQLATEPDDVSYNIECLKELI